MRFFVLVLCLLAIGTVQPVAARPSAMPVPRPAPEWISSEWLNGEATRLQDLRGKVVIVDFFQLWCPGCNAFSIPLLKRWERIFAGTVRFQEFGGFNVERTEALLKTLLEKSVAAVGSNPRETAEFSKQAEPNLRENMAKTGIRMLEPKLFGEQNFRNVVKGVQIVQSKNWYPANQLKE